MDKKSPDSEKPFVTISAGALIGLIVLVVVVVAFIIGSRDNPAPDNVVTPGCHNNVAGNEC